MFETRLGKSYPSIAIEKTASLFSPPKDPVPEICGHCIGTGKMIFTSQWDIFCPYCNGTGQVKKCGCGSGILIGKDEPFCITCKPKPELDLSVLINHNSERLFYHNLSGLYYFPPRRNP